MTPQERAIDRIVEELTRTHGLEIAGLARGLLEAHGEVCGRAPHDWSSADLEVLLLDHFPARVVLPEVAIAQLPVAAVSLLHHLGEPGLAAEAAAMTGGFAAAMRDRDRWSMGKRLWSEAAADGVPMDDQEALTAWIEEFNRRPLEERDRVLGPAPSAAPGRRPPPDVPLVDVPERDLRAAAAASELVDWIEALVGFVGSGRRLTTRDNLKLADGRALVALLGTPDRAENVRSTADLSWLDLVFTLALDAGWLGIADHTVAPLEPMSEDPVERVFAVLYVLLSVCPPGEHFYRGWTNDLLPGIDDALLDVLADLIDAGPQPIDEVAGGLWADLTSYRGPQRPQDVWRDEFELDMVEAVLETVFTVFERLGVVASVEDPDGFEDGRTVEITPLGGWLVSRLVGLVDAGEQLPLPPAELSGLPAAGLLSMVADLPDDTAVLGLEAWLAARDRSEALAELCSALPGADETGRGLVFRALLRAGSDGVAAASVLADHDELWPYLVILRVDTLTADASEMDCGGDPARWVQLVHTVFQLWGAHAAVSAWAGPAAGDTGLVGMLDRAWRVAGPATSEVLGAIGTHHADKGVAKAARKALHKHLSAG